MTHVWLFTTGGTIDKIYGQGKGVRDLHIGDAVAPNVYARMQLGGSVMVHLRSVLAKDSLDITSDDRKKIFDACKNAGPNIIITHGTDTMHETAEMLSEAFPRHTIVLTGALVPASMQGSDAEFNLGMALATCMFAVPAVYIAVNGVHTWDACKKNPKTGIFEPL